MMRHIKLCIIPILDYRVKQFQILASEINQEHLFLQIFKVNLYQDGVFITYQTINQSMYVQYLFL